MTYDDLSQYNHGFNTLYVVGSTTRAATTFVVLLCFNTLYVVGSISRFEVVIKSSKVSIHYMSLVQTNRNICK